MTRNVLALVAALTLTTIATADPVPVPFTFDFEGATVVTPTAGPLTSATIMQDGWQFTISRAAGFEFVDLSPFAGPDGVPTSWGQRSISPFLSFADPEPFTLTIDVMPAPYISLLYASAEFGDFLPSDLDRGSFGGEEFFADNTDPTAFFASGTILSIPLPVGDDGTHIHSWTSGLHPMTFGGGSPGFEQSLFWDNFTFQAIDDLPTSVVAPAVAGAADPTGGAGGIPTGVGGDPVPEPSTVVLVALGAAAVIWRRRRRA